MGLKEGIMRLLTNPAGNAGTFFSTFIFTLLTKLEYFGIIVYTINKIVVGKLRNHGQPGKQIEDNNVNCSTLPKLSA